jgi:hypothetical protein
MSGPLVLALLSAVAYADLGLTLTDHYFEEHRHSEIHPSVVFRLVLPSTTK